MRLSPARLATECINPSLPRLQAESGRLELPMRCCADFRDRTLANSGAALQWRRQDLNLRLPGPKPGEKNQTSLRRQVDPDGFEPSTIRLRGECSANWSYRPKSPLYELNIQPSAYEAGALPIELRGRKEINALALMWGVNSGMVRSGKHSNG